LNATLGSDVRTNEFFEGRRGTIEKLRDLINHPKTEDTIRSVAESKLQILLGNQLPVEQSRRITVHTNVSEADLDRQFLIGIQLGDIYERLCSLSPQPSDIQFMHQGVINIMVPPPFMGKTRIQYTQEVLGACPGARDIKSQMIDGVGYLFSVAFI
jgi:hypothetical protein